MAVSVVSGFTPSGPPPPPFVDPSVCLADTRGHRIKFRERWDIDVLVLWCNCERCGLVFLPGWSITSTHKIPLRMKRETFVRLGRSARRMPPAPPEAYDRMFD